MCVQQLRKQLSISFGLIVPVLTMKDSFLTTRYANPLDNRPPALLSLISSKHASPSLCIDFTPGTKHPRLITH